MLDEESLIFFSGRREGGGGEVLNLFDVIGSDLIRWPLKLCCCASFSLSWLEFDEFSVKKES